jgi:hypothetical protein
MEKSPSAASAIPRSQMQSSFLLLVLSLATAYAIALALFPVICSPRGGTITAVAFAIAALILCPLLIPREQIGLRALAALISTDLAFRVVDSARQVQNRGSGTLDFPSYCKFLIPFPFLLVVFESKSRYLSPGMPKGVEVFRLACAGLIFALVLGLTLAAQSNVILQSSFLLDHTVKVMLFVLAIESLSQCLFGLERLAGFESMPIVDRAFLSRTPAEFWFRYNQRVRLWFTLNVFLPSGGRRAPVRSVFITFFISAMLHELVFGIATSRFDGYQAIFFLLQAPAVIASRQLDRLAARGGINGKAIAHGLTILWMVSTSIFFFYGVNRVFPFVYASTPWLP